MSLPQFGLKIQQKIIFAGFFLFFPLTFNTAWSAICATDYPFALHDKDRNILLNANSDLQISPHLPTLTQESRQKTVSALENAAFSQWSFPQLIAASNNANTISAIQFDSKNNLHMVYTNRPPYSGDTLPPYDIYYTCFNGINWSGPQKLGFADAGMNIGYLNIDLAVDKNDNLHITWEAGYTENSRGVYYSYKRADSSSWSSPLMLASENYSYSISAITSDTNGYLHVVYRNDLYQAGTNPNPKEMYYIYNNGSGWSKPQPLGFSNIGMRLNFVGLSFTADKNNTLHMSWEGQGSNGVWGVYYCRKYATSNTWSTPQFICAENNTNSLTAIAVDSQNRVHMIFRNRPPYSGTDLPPNDIYYTYLDGSSWSTPEKLGFSDSGLSINLLKIDLAIDKNDELHMTWEGNQGVYYSNTKNSLKLLDGTDFSGGKEITSDLQKLAATTGLKVNGCVTDGVSRLLIRLPSDGISRMTFSLEGSGDPNEEGILRSIDAKQEGETIIVNSVNTSQGEMCFAIYQAPEHFVREKYKDKDSTVCERSITVKASSDRSPPVQVSGEIKLYRPAIILVHGLWSGPGVWGPFIKGLKAKLPELHVYTANYQGANASNFETNNDVLIERIKGVKEELQKEKIAMVQVDVFGHSMGGILARIWAEKQGKEEKVYRRDENFQMGDINKLITIDAPHFGSFLADSVITYLNSLSLIKKNEFLGEFIGLKMRLDQGAIEDLATMSPETIQLNQRETDCNSHAIIGDIRISYSKIEIGLKNLLLRLINNKILPAIRTDSDLVVSVESQAGGLYQSKTSTFGHEHMNATTSPEVINRAIELLDENTDTEQFNPGFPINRWPN